MGLSAEDLVEIDALLGPPDADAQALVSIRKSFPKLSLTQCSRSEVDTETPFREYKRFYLYLVDGGGHCWRLTLNLEDATGLVVVLRPVA